MCQLLGMNSSKPARVGFSFAGFAARGGRTGEHRDGWGVAFHTASGCDVITDQAASATSPRAAIVSDAAQRARNVVAHIRKATQGATAPENTHPFTRELWGRTWSFAHNGDLKAYAPALPGRYQPIGQTDSERAFCHLLTQLEARFAQQAPARHLLFEAVGDLARDIARHGSFNFLLSDGAVFFAHCSTSLHYVVREYPFRRARLVDCDLEIDFSKHNHLDDRIAIIATEPLTQDEPWQKFAAGELKMFAAGAPVCAARQQAPFIGIPISY